MFRNEVLFILRWPRWFKRLSVTILDIALCFLTTSLAFYLRLGDWLNVWEDLSTPDLILKPSLAFLLAISLSIPLFISFGLYRAVFRYSGLPTLLSIARACGLYGVIYACIFTVIGIPGVPRTIGLIQPLLLLFAVGGSRVLVSHWLGNSYREQIFLEKIPKVLIYGAGIAGSELAAAIGNSKEMKIIGFVDDDESLHGNHLNGLKVYSPNKLDVLVKVLEVNHVLLAIPSIGRVKRAKIISEVTKLNVSIRTMPSVPDLASGKITVSDLHDLDIEDLLGRDPVAPDTSLLEKNISGKVVVVTGAGGSIGGELCRQIAQLKPAQLILLEQGEFALYAIDQELKRLLQENTIINVSIIPILASVRSESSIRSLLEHYRPHIIFHAAAYKHVPLVEQNPIEGILNNVFGTKNMASLACEIGVPHFVLISTDKAVRPTNIMGASKRLAEMILQALANDPQKSKQTTFSMVRFGNVLNSSGSVVQLFRKQIQEGGPVTLTHLEVTRFLMTIPEAAELVIHASAMAKGGDVFVLDMGEPVKIFDLAKKMIQLSGLKLQDQDSPDGDIAIMVTGLRPGEKLYEELLIGDDPKPTTHSKIRMAREEFLPLADLERYLVVFKESLQQATPEQIKVHLKALVQGYQPK